jgi:cytidylate kinase
MNPKHPSGDAVRGASYVEKAAGGPDVAQSCPSTIAIDGPVASGKSTLGYLLAKKLGYLYFDTGVMYRAVAWVALARGIDPNDNEAVARLSEGMRIDVLPPTQTDGRQYTVTADGVDITWEIRSPEVDVAVSPVSANPGVRAALTPQQRRIGLAGRVVMAGRDIGTVVLPEADLKIYLDALPEERAKRRYRELMGQGQSKSYHDVLESLQRRDAADSGRAAAPLRPADDAVRIDNTVTTIDEMVEQAWRLVNAWTREPLEIPAPGSPLVRHGEAKPIPTWRRVLGPLLRFLIWLFIHVETEGVERLPSTGPLILIVNHIHLLDPVVLVAVVPRYAVAMAKEEIMSWPVIGPLVLRYPTIPVRRGDLDIQAIRQSLAVLKAGHALIIAPEGTRSRSLSLLQGKKGLVFLAQQSGALIQPVAVTGTNAFPHCLKRLRRTPVRFRLGEPFRFRWPEGRLGRDVMQEMADEAMCELARLLPPDMRGVYADLGPAAPQWLEFEQEAVPASWPQRSVS